MNLLRASEFEGRGTWPSGVFSGVPAREKVRIAYRTGQDPGGLVVLDAEPDDWGTGGLRQMTDIIE